MSGLSIDQVSLWSLIRSSGRFRSGLVMHLDLKILLLVILDSIIQGGLVVGRK